MKMQSKLTNLMVGFKPFIYFKEVRAELSKVDWPSREQTIRLTTIVLGVSVFTSLFLGAFDYLFTKMMEIVLSS